MTIPTRLRSTRLRSTAGILVIVALCGPSCEGGSSGFLSLAECTSAPAAVGAEISCRAIVTDFELDCANATVAGTCTRVRRTAPATLTAAAVDDPAVFEVLAFENDLVRLKALAAGSTSIRVTAQDPGGESVTATDRLSAQAPDGMRIGAHCLSERNPSTIALPVSTIHRFTVQLLAGDVVLATDRVPPIEAGALTDAGAAGPDVSYRTPATPTQTQLQSATYPDFALPVHVYDLYGITGLTLVPSETGPYGVGAEVELDVALEVGDKLACAELPDRWSKTVTVTTPSICALRGGESRTQTRVTDPPRVRLQMLAVGACRVSAFSVSTGHSAELALAVSE